jgi:murein DD-endopeptidase MepM/ murein hydrolase activator NlpD
VNIILVSDRLTTSRTLRLSTAHLVWAGVLLLTVPLLLASLLYYFTLIHAGEIKNPYLLAAVANAQQQETSKQQLMLEHNVKAMAVRLGQMQAQLLRLDGLGERLAKTAGFKPQEFDFDTPPAQGGPAVGSQQAFSLEELGGRLDEISRQLDDRADRLVVLDALLSQEHQKKNRLPSSAPVSTGWHSSNFGWRIDPFNGNKAFHEGIDFMAEVGSPVYAAAGGVVTYSDYHPEYGNMIQIDHGNGLVSRYAHASKRLVKVGDIVLRGQEIAKVGSTGRSTGPHLHFEVRFKGVAQDPTRFLQAAK